MAKSCEREGLGITHQQKSSVYMNDEPSRLSDRGRSNIVCSSYTHGGFLLFAPSGLFISIAAIHCAHCVLCIQIDMFSSACGVDSQTPTVTEPHRSIPSECWWWMNGHPAQHITGWAFDGGWDCYTQCGEIPPKRKSHICICRKRFPCVVCVNASDDSWQYIAVVRVLHGETDEWLKDGLWFMMFARDVHLFVFMSLIRPNYRLALGKKSSLKRTGPLFHSEVGRYSKLCVHSFGV